MATSETPSRFQFYDTGDDDGNDNEIAGVFSVQSQNSGTSMSEYRYSQRSVNQDNPTSIQTESSSSHNIDDNGDGVAGPALISPDNSSSASPAPFSQQAGRVPIPKEHIRTIVKGFGVDADLHADVLRVPLTATTREIRIAYFRRGREVLAQADSSDINDIATDQRKSGSRSLGDHVPTITKTRFQAVSMAYEILVDADWKEQYLQHGLRATAATAAKETSRDEIKASDADYNDDEFPPPSNEEGYVIRDDETAEDGVASVSAVSLPTTTAPKSVGPRPAVRWHNHVEELVYAADKNENRTKRRKPKRAIIVETEQLDRHLQQLDEEADQHFVTDIFDELEASVDSLMSYASATSAPAEAGTEGSKSKRASPPRTIIKKNKNRRDKKTDNGNRSARNDTVSIDSESVEEDDNRSVNTEATPFDEPPDGAIEADSVPPTEIVSQQSHTDQPPPTIDEDTASNYSVTSRWTNKSERSRARSRNQSPRSITPTLIAPIPVTPTGSGTSAVASIQVTPDMQSIGRDGTSRSAFGNSTGSTLAGSKKSGQSDSSDSNLIGTQFSSSEDSSAKKMRYLPQNLASMVHPRTANTKNAGPSFEQDDDIFAGLDEAFQGKDSPNVPFKNLAVPRRCESPSSELTGSVLTSHQQSVTGLRRSQNERIAETSAPTSADAHNNASERTDYDEGEISDSKSTQSAVTRNTQESILTGDLMAKCSKLCEFNHALGVVPGVEKSEEKSPLANAAPAATTSTAAPDDFVGYLYSYINAMVTECTAMASSLTTGFDDFESTRTSFYNSFVIQEGDVDDMLSVLTREVEHTPELDPIELTRSLTNQM